MLGRLEKQAGDQVIAEASGRCKGVDTPKGPRALLAQLLRAARPGALAALLSLAGLAAPAAMAAPSSPQTPAAAPSARALTEADLAAFLDGMVPVEMARADIAGVGIAVVKDGRVLLTRGYGMADVAARRPVTPEGTLFRIGSVSKLFTWMAVMQLEEQGKLDLDADVQRYLDFQLRSPELGPVTLRQLMTHRGGFEETISGLWAQPGEDMSLRDYLVRHQPQRIFAPGTVSAYSNYGTTLAAYVVERISGLPFDRYAKQHLLDPLGMANSSFAQPLPSGLKPLMSAGYEMGSGRARDFELIRVGPAGAASASIADMARFMLAQLGDGRGDGRVDGRAVLQPQTLARMQAAQWRHHPKGPALGLGYYESDGYSQRVIGHGGDTQWFHSGLYLLPEQGMGIFVTQNSGGRRNLREPLLRRILERYYPMPARAAKPDQAVAQRVDQSAAHPQTAGKADPSLAGRYLSSRHIASGPLSLGRWFEQTQISIDEQGLLTSSKLKGLNEQPLRFHAVGDGVWETPQDEAGLVRRLYFRRDEASGRWQMSAREPVQVEQQVAWWDDGRLMVPALSASLSLPLLGLLCWPVAALARRHYRQAEPSLRVQQARKALRWSALLLLCPWLSLGLLALPGASDFGYISGPVFALGLRIVQLLAWLMLPALWLAIRATGLKWRAPEAWWWSRLHALLMLLACLTALMLAWRGQLLLGLA